MIWCDRCARREALPIPVCSVVALTLPQDVIDQLHRVHQDLGWAIVKLLDKAPPSATPRGEDTQPDVELVAVAERRSLIVVNREVIRNLPGVNIIPLGGNRAFLALDIDRGMSDLELAVSDRLGDSAIDRRERRALAGLRAHLTTWRRDHGLQFHTRAIIVVERLVKTPVDREGNGARRGAAAKRSSARAAATTPDGPPVTGREVPGAGLRTPSTSHERTRLAGARRRTMSTKNQIGRII